jgi:hypothetical protein
LLATVQVKVADAVARFGRIHGAFVDENEETRLTIRVLDYLLRSHALDEIFPTPLPVHPDDFSAAALWCLGAFGRRALFAAVAMQQFRIVRESCRGVVPSTAPSARYGAVAVD